MKPALLFIGDAACDSGFARATHQYLEALRLDWDVHVLALNYFGDPHPYPYPIYPAFSGGDGFGVNRVRKLVKKIKPEVVVCMNDPWNIPQYQAECGDTPMIAIVAVDGKNCRGAGLNKCRSVVFWTEFGRREAERGGYTGPSTVIPLGVNTDMFYPEDQQRARAMMLGRQHPDGPYGRVILEKRFADAFIVGNVNRNQTRKRMDLTIEYFAEWVHSYNIPNAYLYLHVCPTGDDAYDLEQLMGYYGFNDPSDRRLIMADVGIFRGVSDDALRTTMNTFDVGLTTTQGEGFGLTTFEMFACGKPVIVPAWSALDELCTGGAVKVPCTTTAVTPNRINVVGGVPDKNATVEALQLLYTSEERRRQLGQEGQAVAAHPRYQWSAIAAQLNEHVKEMIL